MKKALAVLALLLLASSGYAADAVKAAAAINIDVDSATVTFCRHVGQKGDPFGGSIAGPGRVETDGSDTQIESAGQGSEFEELAVGDVMEFTLNGAKALRTITSKADNNTVVVDSAIELSADLTGDGVSWRFWRRQCGTGATDGWFDIAGGKALLGVWYFQGDLDELLVRWECRSAAPGAIPTLVFPGPSSDCGITGDAAANPGYCTLANGGINETVTVQVEGFSACRVGLAYGSTDTSDAGAALEQVMVTADVITGTP